MKISFHQSSKFLLLLFILINVFYIQGALAGKKKCKRQGKSCWNNEKNCCSGSYCEPYMYICVPGVAPK
ncbi:unnamed protein product [Cunninghamella blakesleeana]